MHYTNEWDARLAWASFPVFHHWPEIMGGPPVFTHTGFVNVVAPQYADALRKNVEMLREIGVNTVAVTPGELRDLQPFTNVDDIGAAAWEPESGYADPATTVDGFARKAAEMGFPGLRFHDLRGTHETLLLDKGVGIHVVARRCGHDPAVMLRKYAKRLRSADEKAAEALGALSKTALR